ncbi:MAG: zf-HC2 domain-containing protein [Pseudomonadota bacterium]
MTLISDELLMAYADGELDAATRSEVERAIAADASLAERARKQAGLRQRLQAAFQPVLADPVPERLLQAVATAPPSNKVLDMASARAAREGRVARPSAPGWAAWGGMAASVLLGVLIGKVLPDASQEATAFEIAGGQLVARGAIEQGLSTQLASAPVAGATVAVQLSFVDKAGRYCRTFSTATVAGLACRDGAHWTLQNSAPVEGAAVGAMRQAASALPAAILAAVDQRLAGAPLNAVAEEAALRAGWRR